MVSKRVLLLATTTGYQTRMFADAAAGLGVELIYATDRCDQLDDPWRDGAIAVRFHDESRSFETLLRENEARPIDAVLVVGDRPSVIAAHLSRRLGLPGHPPAAVAAARDKRLTRDQLARAGLPTPDFISVAVGADPLRLLDRLKFPVVLKPTMLSASRGVIRVNDGVSFTRAFERVRRLLASSEVRELRDPEAGVILIEEYIPGRELALEGIVEHGSLRMLAIFDKPDPLEGPFFEETIYVTPSRLAADAQRQIEHAVGAAITALGLHHGPIHAECRVNSRGVFVLEVAARPIGGLCAKSLRFQAIRPSGQQAIPTSSPPTFAKATVGKQDLKTSEPQDLRTISFEEFLLRHALGESMAGWTREASASSVMMIPIPRSGLYRGVSGVDEARQVPHVDEIQITAKPDQQLLALPEGASYLGFIFARAPLPAAAEHAVREAHARLRFTIEPLLVVRG